MSPFFSLPHRGLPSRSSALGKPGIPAWPLIRPHRRNGSSPCSLPTTRASSSATPQAPRSSTPPHADGLSSIRSGTIWRPPKSLARRSPPIPQPPSCRGMPMAHRLRSAPSPTNCSWPRRSRVREFSTSGQPTLSWPTPQRAEAHFLTSGCCRSWPEGRSAWRMTTCLIRSRATPPTSASPPRNGATKPRAGRGARTRPRIRQGSSPSNAARLQNTRSISGTAAPATACGPSRSSAPPVSAGWESRAAPRRRAPCSWSENPPPTWKHQSATATDRMCRRDFLARCG